MAHPRGYLEEVARLGMASFKLDIAMTCHLPTAYTRAPDSLKRTPAWEHVVVTALEHRSLSVLL